MLRTLRSPLILARAPAALWNTRRFNATVVHSQPKGQATLFVNGLFPLRLSLLEYVAQRTRLPSSFATTVYATTLLPFSGIICSTTCARSSSRFLFTDSRP